MLKKIIFYIVKFIVDSLSNLNEISEKGKELTHESHVSTN